jgi:hypothetical protein
MQTLLEKLYALRNQQSECPLKSRAEIQKKIIIVLKTIDALVIAQKMKVITLPTGETK